MFAKNEVQYMTLSRNNSSTNRTVLMVSTAVQTTQPRKTWNNTYYLVRYALFVILRLSILVSGDLGFHIWGFLLCGEASLFLSDETRLGVLDTGPRDRGKVMTLSHLKIMTYKNSCDQPNQSYDLHYDFFYFI